VSLIDSNLPAPLETALPPCLTSASHETTRQAHPSELRPPDTRKWEEVGKGSRKTYRPEASLLAVIYDLYEREGGQSVKRFR
jgi:hypothetical protein